MTLSEFKNGLPPYIINGEYDGTIDLLTDWDGHSDITSGMADGYNCTLGNVISTLDNMGINHDLECSDTGMYIRISICW